MIEKKILILTTPSSAIWREMTRYPLPATRPLSSSVNPIGCYFCPDFNNLHSANDCRGRRSDEWHVCTAHVVEDFYQRWKASLYWINSFSFSPDQCKLIQYNTIFPNPMFSLALGIDIFFREKFPAVLFRAKDQSRRRLVNKPNSSRRT